MTAIQRAIDSCKTTGYDPDHQFRGVTKLITHCKGGQRPPRQPSAGLEKEAGSLEKIDWSRSNARLWEGRALIGGMVSKVTTNVILTTNVIKKALGLPLDTNEQRIETAARKRYLK